jgi:hypothetical protein
MDLSSSQTAAGTKTFSSNPILSGGTANGVAYLNGSKVLTTGSALTFDGTTLGTAKLNASNRATFTASSFDAIAASTGTLQGQTSYGGVLAGYGSSYDVMLCNRSGSEAFGVLANTQNVAAAGSLKGASTISVGNATPSTSGAGITFPATQSASTNANTLDDYEEGTWTPTLTAYAGSITAYTSQGSYVKIGRIVFATVYAVVSNAGTASGAYIISNLPFSLATSAEVYGYGVNLLNNVGLVAYGSGSTSLYCFTAAGAFPGGSGTYVTLNFNYSV